MNSTNSQRGSAAASCRSAASPHAVFQPCGIIRIPASYAANPILYSSEIPPTLVTSGCRMSTARFSIHGKNDSRRVSTSQAAIGTAEA